MNPPNDGPNTPLSIAEQWLNAIPGLIGQHQEVVDPGMVRATQTFGRQVGDAIDSASSSVNTSPDFVRGLGVAIVALLIVRFGMRLL